MSKGWRPPVSSETGPVNCIIMAIPAHLGSVNVGAVRGLPDHDRKPALGVKCQEYIAAGLL